MMRTLITGATGFLGSNVLPLLLDQDKEITLLVRDPARLREDARGKCRLVAGDVTKPNLGIEEPVEDLDELFHLAALIFFNGKRGEELRLVNVNGVKNALEFALRRNCQRFYHVSTVYICGDAKDVWYEKDIDRGQRLKNNYEQTKLEGELLVHEFCQKHGMEAVIFRPSVIVGDSKTAEVPALQTVYQVIAILELFKRQVKRGVWRFWQLPLRGVTLPGRKDGNLNMVPVDYVAEAVSRITLPGTYHLVNSSPPTFGEMSQWISPLIHLALKWETRAKLPPLLARLAEFIPYLEGDPVFDDANAKASLGKVVTCPKIDREFFRKMVAVTREHLKRLGMV